MYDGHGFSKSCGVHQCERHHEHTARLAHTLSIVGMMGRSLLVLYLCEDHHASHCSRVSVLEVEARVCTSEEPERGARRGHPGGEASGQSHPVGVSQEHAMQVFFVCVDAGMS